MKAERIGKKIYNSAQFLSVSTLNRALISRSSALVKMLSALRFLCYLRFKLFVCFLPFHTF